jgi:hydroxymethylglutaryl-CoA reductase (NADPH)
MATDYRHASDLLRAVMADRSREEIERSLSPKMPVDGTPAPLRVPGGTGITPEAIDRRWQLLQHARPESRAALADERCVAEAEQYRANVEHFIGMVKVPVGLAGPLRVNGLFAQGDYYVPLATTEAALVASYSRGARLMTEAGGCTAVLLNEGISRTPGFAFRDLRDVARFLEWTLGSMDEFRRRAQETTRHGQLADVRVTVEGNHVYLHFEFTTGDASGQNMVTIATQAVCDYIHASSPVKPLHHFVEANMSGDKKLSMQSFLTVRGKKVTAEAVVPAELIAKRLHTTARRMADYWAMAAMGGVLSGQIGIQGHYANGLAALYLACGQDVACVAESAVGATRFEVRDDGALYAAVTLPNLVVGTVGGGTKLPSQQACLDVMGLTGPDHARALAEVCAGLALAGELSIIGALCAGDFSQAHERLARGRAAARQRESNGDVPPSSQRSEVAE